MALKDRFSYTIFKKRFMLIMQISVNNWTAYENVEFMHMHIQCVIPHPPNFSSLAETLQLV